MIERCIDRIYLAFVAIAVCSELFLLTGIFGAEPPYGGWADFFGEIAIMGFLNFLAIYWIIASWKFHWLGGLTQWFQLVLVLAVMTLVVWGRTQGWRPKLAIMALLTLPGVALFAYDSWLRHT